MRTFSKVIYYLMCEIQNNNFYINETVSIASTLMPECGEKTQNKRRGQKDVNVSDQTNKLATL